MHSAKAMEGKMKVWCIAALAALIGALPAGCALVPDAMKSTPADTAGRPAAAFAVIPPDKDSDLKLYYANGRIINGGEALGRMQQEAGLILWLAGNQFFAMDDAARFLAFLATPAGQAAYRKYGFVMASPGELLPKAIP